MANTRPDFNGSNYDDTFIGDLVNFVASNGFQSMFETYFLTHALKFSDDEEHKLEYYEMFQEFHKLFEDQLQIFCDEKGISQEDFMERCSEAETGDVSLSITNAILYRENENPILTFTPSPSLSLHYHLLLSTSW